VFPVPPDPKLLAKTLTSEQRAMLGDYLRGVYIRASAQTCEELNPLKAEGMKIMASQIHADLCVIRTDNPRTQH